MKKYFNTFWVYIISFCLAALFVILTTSQTKPQTQKQLPVTDSTISVKELQTFNEWLKKSVSYEQYMKLNPEQVIIELWNWKANEIKKQIADTTTKKK